MAARMTTLKSEKETPLGLLLDAFVEALSPQTTPLWLDTSCGLSLCQMLLLVEQDLEPPFHTVSKSIKPLLILLLKVPQIC